VGGADQDAQQGPLGHPLPQGGLQRQRGLGGAGCPVCFQAGPALVVDYQIGVVRVARIGRRALGGELALQGLPELTGRGGQAHLGAVGGSRRDRSQRRLSRS
jgi:hypothetical protein